MSMDDELLQKIKDNNSTVSNLLQENEQLFRDAGYNPPAQTAGLPFDAKIPFPAGYIRTVDHYYRQYHLVDICAMRTTRDNIAYTLESSDLLNYIFNRFGIWGPVETILYKLSIVNMVSVIEAFVLEAANNICDCPSSCGNTSNCPYHFSKAQRDNAKHAIQKLSEMDALKISADELSRLNEIIDLRNRIHIRLTQGNELKMDDFNIALHNEIIQILKTVNDQIYQYAVPLYHCGQQGSR